MHNLMKYVCDELEEIDSKAKKGKLAQGEMEYTKDLVDLKKNLLKIEKLSEGGNYSNAGQSYRNSYADDRYNDGNSYVRSMGYSRDGEYGNVYARDDYSMRSSYGNLEKHLEDMARQEHDMGKRRKIENFLDELKRM